MAVGGRGTAAAMTVADLAESLGTTVRALRHYEDVLLLNPARDARQTRLYGPEDRARAEMIVVLRRADIPLKSIEVAVNGRSAFDTNRVADLLEDRLAVARAQVAEIERLLPALRSGDLWRFEYPARPGEDRERRTALKSADSPAQP